MARVADDADRARLQAVILQLKAIRLDNGLSQGEVAKRMGTSQSAVSDIEAFVGDVNTGTLFRYARALGARLWIEFDMLPEQ